MFITITYLGKLKMKSIQNYSINVKVLEEFNREVKDQTRSRLVEALIVNWLCEYSGVEHDEG